MFLLGSNIFIARKVLRVHEPLMHNALQTTLIFNSSIGQKVNHVLRLPVNESSKNKDQTLMDNYQHNSNESDL